MFDSAYYDTAHQNDAGTPAILAKIDTIASRVAAECVGTVLDLGCGLGLLANKVPGFYCGVDFSEWALNYARGHCRNPKALFLQDDLLYSITPHGWDTVVLSEVLEHFGVESRDDICYAARTQARKRVLVTVPVGMELESHVKPRWSEHDLRALLGDDVKVEQFEAGGMAFWLARKDL